MIEAGLDLVVIRKTRACFRPPQIVTGASDTRVWRNREIADLHLIDDGVGRRIETRAARSRARHGSDAGARAARDRIDRVGVEDFARALRIGAVEQVSVKFCSPVALRGRVPETIRLLPERTDAAAFVAGGLTI